MLPTAHLFPPDVLALLAGQRSVSGAPGTDFTVVLNRLAFLEQDVLVGVSTPGEPPASLLVQKGRAVHAQCGPLTGEDALQGLLPRLPDSTLRLIALRPAAAALAFAAVSGTLEHAPQPDTQGLSAHLTGLAGRLFSGVVASKVRDSLNVWHFVRGQVRAQQELTEVSAPGAYLQLAWAEHVLPKLEVPALPVAASASQGSPALGSSPAPAQTAPAGFTPLASPNPVSLGPLSLDDARIWAVFHRTLQAHVGEAAARLMALMQDLHGDDHGSLLLDALGAQVNRVAGHDAETRFREHLLTAPPSLPASGGHA